MVYYLRYTENDTEWMGGFAYANLETLHASLKKAGYKEKNNKWYKEKQEVAIGTLNVLNKDSIDLDIW